jgi:hypothetical protein
VNKIHNKVKQGQYILCKGNENQGGKEKKKEKELLSRNRK